MTTGQTFATQYNKLLTQATPGQCMTISRKQSAQAQLKLPHLKSKSREVISDKAKQLERWVEYCAELYSTDNTVSQAAFDAVERLPTIPELEKYLSLKEVANAIDKLPSGKAPDKDCVLVEVIKSSKS